MQKATQPIKGIDPPPYQYDQCMKQVAMVTTKGTPLPRGTS